MEELKRYVVQSCGYQKLEAMLTDGEMAEKGYRVHTITERWEGQDSLFTIVWEHWTVDAMHEDRMRDVIESDDTTDLSDVAGLAGGQQS